MNNKSCKQTAPDEQCKVVRNLFSILPSDALMLFPMNVGKYKKNYFQCFLFKVSLHKLLLIFVTFCYINWINQVNGKSSHHFPSRVSTFDNFAFLYESFFLQWLQSHFHTSYQSPFHYNALCSM